MRATMAQAMAAIAECPRIAVQYIYSPGDRYGTRYVVTIQDADGYGTRDRTLLGARAVLNTCAVLNNGKDI